MLLVSNLGTIGVGYFDYELFDQKERTMLNIWMVPISYYTQDLPFCLSHFLLADKYTKIAREVPCRLEGKPEKKLTTVDHVWYYVQLGLNIAFPTCKFIAIRCMLQTKTLKQQVPSHAFLLFYKISWAGIGLIQCLSGYQLIKGIMTIRNFFKRKNAVKFINTGMLLRHASCFGLYLGTTMVMVSFQLWYSFNLHPGTFKIYVESKIYYELGAQSFLLVQFNQFKFSEVLFCIFWDLGSATKIEDQAAAHRRLSKTRRKEAAAKAAKAAAAKRAAEEAERLSMVAQQQEAEEEEDYQMVVEEEFDDDAQLQARIWNALVRKASEEEDEEIAPFIASAA